MESLAKIGATLWQIAGNFGELAMEVWQLGASWALLLLWVVWWLGAVNWKKLWPVLGRGAWMPLLLLCVLTAMVWSHLSSVSCDCGLPSFWWQLGATFGLVTIALLCGWIQGLFHWEPADINLNPPSQGHGHHHGHGHH